MAEYEDREHYIPLRRSDLIELLCTDKGLLAQDRDQFRQFCRLVTAWYHFQYHEELEVLKNEYAPFDPDAVTKPIRELLVEEKEQKLQQLYQKFSWLMERCNFKRVTREELEKATEIASDWGVNMDVDFSAFDYLEVFIRGDSIGQRFLRRWPRIWKLETVKVPIYQRMVLILKQRKHKRLGPTANTTAVYLKLFKDVPKVDIEMLIPGGKLKMPGLARGKLGASMAGTGGFVGYKIFTDFGAIGANIAEASALLTNPLLFWGPLSLVLGYGYKQFAGYHAVRKTYSHQLTQSLYYQTLDSNAGVLFHLLDEAEEQECREAILAYYYLWRYAGDKGWRAPDLDDYVELDLERLAGLKVDFEIEDALDKLDKLGIIEKVADRYRALPLEKALEIIDYKWDNYFQYNKEFA